MEREAIAGGSIEGRLIAVRDEGLGEHMAVGFEQRKRWSGGAAERGSFAGDQVEGGVKGKDMIHVSS